MKVRIKFSKTGALVYIGHLDVMRYFQKLFRRTGMPIAYSEGFSPHQILSFSHPLPLGMESVGEYADIELTESVSSKAAVEMLRSQSVPEIGIISFRQLDEKCENAMASVKAARYTVDFADNNPYKDLEKLIEEFFAKEEFVITKVTKKNTKEVNIRPLVFECFVNKESNLEMLISSGSTDNLKPEVVLNALASIDGIEIDPDDFHIKRIEQYTFIDEKLVSLEDVGKDIL